MALKIRLARGGPKKRPYYHIVIADVRSPRDGRFIEKIGHWNPMLPRDDEGRAGINIERAKHWLSNGAQPTDRVARFLADAGLIEQKTRNNPNKAQPGKKAQQRLAEKKAREEEALASAGEASSTV